MKRDWKVSVLLLLLIVSTISVVNELFDMGLPDLSEYFTLKYWGGNHSRLESLRNFALIAGTPLALWLALRRTSTATRQADLAERGQNTDRYQQAVNMLGNEKLSVREAGIFVLQALGETDADNHYFPVQNILCAFIRDRSKELYINYEKDMIDGVDHSSDGIENCTSDIIEAIVAMSSLRTSDNIKRETEVQWHPNLMKSYLYGFSHTAKLNLSNANLRGAIFDRSTIHYANFQSAMLIISAIDTTYFKCDFSSCTFAHTETEACVFNEETKFFDCTFTKSNRRMNDFTICDIRP